MTDLPNNQSYKWMMHAKIDKYYSYWHTVQIGS